MKKKLALIFAIMMCFVLTGCNSPLKQPKEGEGVFIKDEDALIWYIKDLGFVTGENARRVTTQKWGLGATDLGIPFYDSEIKRLYFAYGDSYTGYFRGIGQWNSNQIMYTDTLNFTKGIKWKGSLPCIRSQNGGEPEYYRTITPARTLENMQAGIVTPGTHTHIPTGGIVINGVYYLFYMEITSAGFTGSGWSVHANRVMKSTDRGQTWTAFPEIIWKYADAPNFGQVFPLEVGEYVYLYAIPGGREGGTQLARVLKTNFENMDEYEYYIGLADGEPVFVKGAEGLENIKDQRAETLVIPAPCGEMSVMYNKYLGKFVATYQGKPVQTDMVLRTADNPYGPFSASEVILSYKEYPQLYGAFSHEMMTTHDGQRMFIQISLWQDYNVKLFEIVFKDKDKLNLQ